VEQLEWYYAPPMCECPLCWDVPDWKGEAVFQGDVLRGLRLGHGLSQSELAEAMRVSRRTIAYWEASHFMPSDLHLYQMAVVFYVPVECFLRHKDRRIKLVGLWSIPLPNSV
jgi:DNA-binding XRE family transcriptional regulator